MKRHIFIFNALILILSNSCTTYNSKSAKVELEDTNTISINHDFLCFVDSFELHALPFSILCKAQFIKKMILVPETSRYTENKYKSISKGYFKYLYELNTEQQNIEYRYGYKAIENDQYIGLIYIKDSIDVDWQLPNSHWIILNIYSKNGTLLDKIRLAGEEFDVIDQFCNITVNDNTHTVKIITDSYWFLEDTLVNTPYVFARHEKNQYQINALGLIEKTESTTTIGKFQVDKDGCYRNAKENY
jgi:hypothetical protein